MSDESKRTPKTERLFLNAEGEDLGRNPSVDCATFRFKDMTSGDAIEVSRADLFGSDDVSGIKPAGVLAAWFGLKTNLGNAYGGAKGEDPMEPVRARLELILDGEWSEGKGEGGPRKTLLAEAIVRAKAEEGVERTIEQAVEFLASKTKDEKAAIAKDAKVAYHYAAIQDEQRRERLKKLKAAAKDAGGTALDF